jgi:hypothetical protein
VVLKNELFRHLQLGLPELSLYTRFGKNKIR